MANTESGERIRETGNKRDGRSSSGIGLGRGAAVGTGGGGVMSKICTVDDRG